MKKLILLIAALLVFSSCGLTKETEKKEAERKPEMSYPIETPFTNGPAGLLPPTN